MPADHCYAHNNTTCRQMQSNIPTSSASTTNPPLYTLPTFLNCMNTSASNDMQLMPINKPEIGNENFLKSCFEMLPAIANKLLDKYAIESVAAVPVPEKKYDMKLQKEISELQGKQLFYTCPGAAVVSFDGPGIDCKANIDATAMSLNQRFA